MGRETAPFLIMKIINEFTCTVCGATTEKLVESGTVEILCPHCGEIAIKALSAPRIFSFRGNGFYETDFKSKK